MPFNGVTTALLLFQQVDSIVGAIRILCRLGTPRTTFAGPAADFVPELAGLEVGFGRWDEKRGVVERAVADG